MPSRHSTGLVVALLSLHLLASVVGAASSERDAALRNSEALRHVSLPVVGRVLLHTCPDETPLRLDHDAPSLIAASSDGTVFAAAIGECTIVAVGCADDAPRTRSMLTRADAGRRRCAIRVCDEGDRITGLHAVAQTREADDTLEGAGFVIATQRGLVTLAASRDDGRAVLGRFFGTPEVAALLRVPSATAGPEAALRVHVGTHAHGVAYASVVVRSPRTNDCARSQAGKRLFEYTAATVRLRAGGAHVRQRTGRSDRGSTRRRPTRPRRCLVSMAVRRVPGGGLHRGDAGVSCVVVLPAKCRGSRIDNRDAHVSSKRI